MSYQKLDGPAKQYSLSVTTSVVVEVVNVSALDERAVVTIQPLDSDIWVYFGDGINTPTVSNLQNSGFLHFKKSMDSYEAGSQQKLYILAVSGTTSVRIAERA